jgi:hypothetical protein
MVMCNCCPVWQHCPVYKEYQANSKKVFELDGKICPIVQYIEEKEHKIPYQSHLKVG